MADDYLSNFKMMKKQKLTPEEKEEIRKENKAWRALIKMAKEKGALVDEEKEPTEEDYEPIERDYDLER